MSTPWWTGLAPVETVVACGDERHRVRWAEGTLSVLDHVHPEGERTLAALGGTSCACIEILDAWQRHREDLDVLLLGSRGSTDPLQPLQDQPRFQPLIARPRRPAGRGGPPAGWVAYSPSQGGAEEGDDLAQLLRLPTPLPSRLAATVAAAWSQRLADGDERAVAAMPMLRAALAGRALAALDQWIGLGSGDDVRLAEAPTAGRDEDDSVRLDLPFSWLVDVWARGFAIVADRFCLSATLTGPGTWTLATVGPDLGDSQEITLILGS